MTERNSGATKKEPYCDSSKLDLNELYYMYSEGLLKENSGTNDPRIEKAQTTNEINDPRLEKVQATIESFVGSISTKIGVFPNDPYYDDCMGAGQYGLHRAFQRFDLRFKCSFYTYATIRVRGEILDFLRNNDPLSLTRSHMILLKKINDAKNAPGNDFRLKDLESKRIPLWYIKLIRYLAENPPLSLDKQTVLSDNDGSISDWHELVTDTSGSANPVEDLVTTRDSTKHIIRLARSLPERLKRVIALRFFDDLTFKKIGIQLEVSEVWACYLYHQAIKELRVLAKEEGLID